MSWKMNIDENGISIKVTPTKQYIDPDTGDTVEVATAPGNRRAIGMGDYPDKASFQAAIEGFVTDTLGTGVAQTLANVAADRAELDSLKQEVQTLKQERDKLINERQPDTPNPNAN